MEMLKSVWLFFQDQILGMKWLNAVIGDALSLLGVDIQSRLGGSVQFFVYDVLKITVLLCFLIFVIFLYTELFSTRKKQEDIREI